MRRPTPAPPISRRRWPLGRHSFLPTGLAVAASRQPPRVMTQRTDSGGGRKRRARQGTPGLPTAARRPTLGLAHGPCHKFCAGQPWRFSFVCMGALGERCRAVRWGGLRPGKSTAFGSGLPSRTVGKRHPRAGCTAARHALCSSDHDASGWPTNTGVEAWPRPRLEHSSKWERLARPPTGHWSRRGSLRKGG